MRIWNLARAGAAATALAGGMSSAQACWDAVAAKYAHTGVSAKTLMAIAAVESGLHANATNLTHAQRTGSFDIGLMQINSRWLPLLHQRFGIDEKLLRENWCVNLDAGAWILADLYQRMGPGWDAIGAYNAACARGRNTQCLQDRHAYAWKVYRRLVAIEGRIPTSSGPATKSIAAAPARTEGGT
jgi:soluble lytic murein transglycosylase-like protein